MRPRAADMTVLTLQILERESRKWKLVSVAITP